MPPLPTKRVPRRLHYGPATITLRLHDAGCSATVSRETFGAVRVYPTVILTTRSRHAAQRLLDALLRQMQQTEGGDAVYEQLEFLSGVSDD